MMSNLAPLPPNTQLGEYVLERLLARGGFGFTYLAIRPADMQRVVIKENYPCLGCTRMSGQYAFVKPSKKRTAAKGGEEWSAANFCNEVLSLRSLNHPGVPKVLDDFYVPETGTSYYVMPYYSGGTLLAAVTSAVTPSPQGVMFLAAALMSVLAHIHGSGLLHRDIKPENVVFSSEGYPVLLDFGAARLVESERFTRVISKEYSPQEQVEGGKQGPWTDIYALGATLYFAITGTHVPESSARSKEHDPYVPLVGQRPLVLMYGERFLSSVDKALSMEPCNRFLSVQQWEAELHGIPGFQAKHPVRLASTWRSEDPINCETVLAQAANSQGLVVESLYKDPGIRVNNVLGKAQAVRTKKVLLSILLMAVLLSSVAVATILLWPGKTGRSAVEMAFASSTQLCIWGDAEPNPDRALELYQAAAEKGNGRAMFALGSRFKSGKDVDRDLGEAARWYKKAAELNYSGAAEEYQEVVDIRREEDNAAKLEKAKTLLAGDKYAMAMELLAPLAEQENADAQLLLGECYFAGNGVEKNLDEAEKWFSKAVTNGNEMANECLKKIAAERRQIEIAAQIMQAKEMQSHEEYSRAVELLLPLAKQGNTEAERLLDECRQQEAAREREESAAILQEAQTLREKKEYEREVRLLRPLAEKGNIEAQMHLGNKYLNGQGVAYDVHLALFWFQKAAEQGYTYAQNLVGLFYYQGLYGLKSDMAEGVSWIRKSAESGYAEAQYNLANIYFSGEGVMQNSKEGEKWLTSAATQGYTEAQQQLGIRYMMGKSLSKNIDTAKVWLHAAAEKGDVIAQFHLGILYQDGGELDESQKWLELAAEQGYLDAKYALGVLYYYKRGGKTDKQKGISLWKEAAEAGSEVARNELKRIKKSK